MHSLPPFVDLSIGSMIHSRMMHGAEQNKVAQLFLVDIFRQTGRMRGSRKACVKNLLFLVDHV
jgi:hypothetical protein